MEGAVVVIGGDEASRAWATGLLQTGGRATCGFPGARPFFAQLRGPGPACVVVDDPPDMTCTQVQAEGQRRGLRAPLLFVVGPAQVELAVCLLKAGAADVLARPLDGDELRRRVHAVAAAAKRARAGAHQARARLARLTERELEVALLATSGLGNKDIAEQLHISFRTVEVHRRNALRKTGSANVVELTHFVGPARGDPRVAQAMRRFALSASPPRASAPPPRRAEHAPALAAHDSAAPAREAGAAIPAPVSGQLSLWATQEPVRGVQRSESPGGSLP